MIWRDERQKAQVCMRLYDLALSERDVLGQGARLLMELAWAVWDERRGPDGGEMFDRLSRRNRAVTAAFALAALQGPAALDGWLDFTSQLLREEAS